MSGRLSQRRPEGRSGRAGMAGRRGLGIDTADPPTGLLRQARNLVDSANSYLAILEDVEAYNAVVDQIKGRAGEVEAVESDSDFTSGLRQRAGDLLSQIQNLSTLEASSYSNASDVPAPKNGLLDDIEAFLADADAFRQKQRREAAEQYNRIVDELKNTWLPKLQNFADNPDLPQDIRSTAGDLVTRIQDLTKISVPGS